MHLQSFKNFNEVSRKTCVAFDMQYFVRCILEFICNRQKIVNFFLVDTIF